MNKVLNFTERLLLDAGIKPGMKVLDIGCGFGEVTFLIAELIGKSGEVIGIDSNELAITKAKGRIKESGFSNINFKQEDLTKVSSELGRFDAVVARRVLMYLPNVRNILRNLSNLLAPYGLFVFQESDSTLVPGGIVSLPLHDRVINWMWRTVESEDGDIHIGFKLPQIMTDAGIVIDHIRAEPVIQGQGSHYPLHFIIRAMLPRIIEHNIANEEEIDIDTLEERLSMERSNEAVYVSDMAFGIWGHKPKESNLKNDD